MNSSSFVMPTFPKLPLHFLENVPILFIIFIAFFTIYIIVSIILFYHWIKYGTHKSIIIFVEVAFIAVSIGLFTVSFLALNYY